MWTVYIWVPGKGWKQVKSFALRISAHIYATVFHPLETRVESPTGDNYYGGKHCMPTEASYARDIYVDGVYLAKHIP